MPLVKSISKSQTKRIKLQTNTKTTLVNFILDETGSMQDCKEATISGFNEYIKNLQKDGKNIVFSLTTFNSERINTPYVQVPIEKVEPLTNQTYQPDNLTPLYDAIAQTIKKTGEVKGKKILCVVMTDGYENASKEYTREKIFKLIKEKEKEGWNFIYLGANQDSWAVGNAIGLSAGNVVNFQTQNIKGALRGLSHSTACYAMSTDRITTNFFDKYNYSDKDKEEKSTT